MTAAWIDPALCSFEGCGRKVQAKALCMGHYSQRRLKPEEPLTPLGRRAANGQARENLHLHVESGLMLRLRRGAELRGLPLSAHAESVLAGLFTPEGEGIDDLRQRIVSLEEQID